MHKYTLVKIRFLEILLFICGEFELSFPDSNEESGRYHPIPQGSLTFVEKPYRKASPHSEEVEWWRTFMVE